MNKQICVFNETITNIFENFIPHEAITFNDKDPPWMNKQIKTIISEKNALYKHLMGRMVNSNLLDKLDALQAKLQSSLTFSILITIGKSQKIYLIHPLVLNAIRLY